MNTATYPQRLYFWRVIDPLRPGRRYTTRHRMTAAEAQALDPSAERVEESCLIITAPSVATSTPGRGPAAGRPPLADGGAQLGAGHWQR